MGYTLLGLLWFIDEIVQKTIAINDKIITIMMDELSSKEGIETRIESFIDILKKEDIYE